jgi:hypothetical protein
MTTPPKYGEAGLDPTFLAAMDGLRKLNRQKRRLLGPYAGLVDLALEHASYRRTEDKPSTPSDGD